MQVKVKIIILFVVFLFIYLKLNKNKKIENFKISPIFDDIQENDVITSSVITEDIELKERLTDS